MEPPVSVPSEMTDSPATTAAVLPPEEPPGTRVVSHGLRGVGLNADDSLDEPNVYSSRFVLPMTIAPAASSRSTAVAVYGAMKFSSILLAAVERLEAAGAIVIG